MVVGGGVVVPVEGEVTGGVVVGGGVVAPVPGPAAGGVAGAVGGGFVVGDEPVPVGIELTGEREEVGRIPDPQPLRATLVTANKNVLIPWRDIFERITLLNNSSYRARRIRKAHQVLQMRHRPRKRHTFVHALLKGAEQIHQNPLREESAQKLNR